MKTMLITAAAWLLASSALAATPPAPVTDLGPGLVGVYYPPAKPGGPTLLVLGGSEGGFAGSGAMAKSLAEEGYGALAISYFKGPGQAQILEEIPLETFAHAIDWLSARPETGRRRIGLIGVSKGAEAGLLVAARDPRICSVVAAVPSSVAWQGVNPANFASGKPSWTEGGQPLAFARYDFSRPTAGLRSFYEGGLAKAPSDAVIPVEKIRGPVLLVSGRQDNLWPSTPMAEAIMARLDAAKFRYPHTHLAYDNAGHAAFGKPFPPPRGPVNPAVFAQAGGTLEGTQAARIDGWTKALKFLSDSLTSRGCAAR